MKEKIIIYVAPKNGDFKVLGKFKLKKDGTGEFFDIIDESFFKKIKSGIKNGFNTREGKIYPLQEPEKFYKKAPELLSGSYAFWTYEK